MTIYFTFLLIILLWLYILSLLKRARLMAFYYLWGSFGLFFLLSIISNYFFSWIMPNSLVYCLKAFSKILPDYIVNLNQNSILINNVSGHEKLIINYANSGIIELITFISLLLFFPVYKKIEKVTLSVLGTFWIFLTSLMRILLTIVIAHNFGIQYLFISYSLIGRLGFYVMIVILYYYVFTRAQIVRGWIHNAGKRGIKECFQLR